jgi:hypothetical protein
VKLSKGSDAEIRGNEIVADTSGVINATNDSITNQQKSDDAVINSIASSPVVKRPLSRTRGIIVGLTGGPEWNEVKRQGRTKTGYDIGMIVGYTFSSRFSIETGLSIAKKYYYSEGKFLTLKCQ